MAYLRHGAVAVVCHRFNQQSHAPRSIPFISDLFVVDAFFFASTTTNRSVNGVVRHVAGLGVDYRFSQASVSVRVTAARAGSHSYFFNKLREKFAALGIERALLVLDTM